MEATKNAIYENICREEAAKNNLPIYVELRRGDLIRYLLYRIVSYRFSNWQGSSVFRRSLHTR